MPIATADPSTPPAARPRLSRQCEAVLASFLSAPQRTLTGSELLKVAHRFGAMLHDLRRAGYRIDLVRRDHANGLTMYEMRGEP